MKPAKRKRGGLYVQVEDAFTIRVKGFKRDALGRRMVIIEYRQNTNPESEWRTEELGVGHSADVSINYSPSP